MQAIERSLYGLKFGLVTVVVQDGRIVQIDRTERQRLDQRRKG
ncbi:MAG: YezD family protein [Planctomycetes bacterium]|nr:YezD family protein [Planctomycetota bacterium]